MKFHGNVPFCPPLLYINTPTHILHIEKNMNPNPQNRMEYHNSRRSKDQMGGRSKPDMVVCRKHPKHRQSPGVCSICLSERLSHISTSSRGASSSAVAAASSSSSSSISSYSSHYSSSEASSCASPMQRYRFAAGSASGGKGSFSFFSSGKNMLTKSRSVAFVTRMRAGDGGGGRHHPTKKSGFWSKLLPPSGRSQRTDEVLGYSRTVRERVGATRVH